MSLLQEMHGYLEQGVDPTDLLNAYLRAKDNSPSNLDESKTEKAKNYLKRKVSDLEDRIDRFGDYADEKVKGGLKSKAKKVKEKAADTADEASVYAKRKYRRAKKYLRNKAIDAADYADNKLERIKQRLSKEED